MRKLVAFVVFPVLTLLIIPYDTWTAASWEFGYVGYTELVRGVRQGNATPGGNGSQQSGNGSQLNAPPATKPTTTTTELTTTIKLTTTTKPTTSSRPVTLCDPLHLMFSGFMFNHFTCDHYCGTKRKYGRGSCKLGKCVCL